MSWNKTREPVMPEFTCGKIDRVLAAIQEANKIVFESGSGEVAPAELEDAHAEIVYLRKQLADIGDLLYGEEDRMELIRGANEDLRHCADYWKEQCGAIEIERDQFEQERDQAHEEISELNELIERMGEQGSGS